MFYILDKGTGRAYEVLGDVLPPPVAPEQKKGEEAATFALRVAAYRAEAARYRPRRAELGRAESEAEAARICAQKGITSYELTDDPARIASHRTTYDQQLKMGVIRRKRDELLRASDHVMLADSPYIDSLEWRRYRQALRDLPSTVGPSTAIETVDWPETPA